jgi:hypothetical protein
MKHELNRLDHRGHGPLATWGDDETSQKAAADIFQLEQLPTKEGGRGRKMYDISAGPPGVLLEKFAPEAREILSVPQLQAG